MSNIQEMNCPSCGASYGLEEMNSSGEVRCKFCGTRFLVPESLRPVPASIPEIKIDPAASARYARIAAYVIGGFILFMVCTTLLPTCLGLAAGFVGVLIPFLVR